MITLRKLIKTDEQKLLNLINTIEQNLPDKKFWLPISSIEKEHFLDDDWTYFLGLFDDDKLVGASGLFLNESQVGELGRHCQNAMAPIAEISRVMVLPEYRGQNLLFRINTELLNVARSKGIKTILVTIHPNNMPSQHSFAKLGAQKITQIVKYNDFLRDILLLKL